MFRIALAIEYSNTCGCDSRVEAGQFRWESTTSSCAQNGNHFFEGKECLSHAPTQPSAVNGVACASCFHHGPSPVSRRKQVNAFGVLAQYALPGVLRDCACTREEGPTVEPAWQESAANSYLLQVSLTILRVVTRRSPYSSLLDAFSTCFVSLFSSALVSRAV
jgi:hypothetical protein